MRNAKYVFKLQPWSISSFLFAFIGVALAFGLRELFASVGATLYFATFYPAILIISLLVGYPAAILSTALVSLLVWWAIFPPRLAFGPLSTTDLANFLLFWFSASLIIMVSHLYRTALGDLLRAEKARQLLLNELNHRIGNTFSVIQAVINGTVEDRQVAQRVSDRIAALSRANALITRTSVETVSLADVILNEVVRGIDSAWKGPMYGLAARPREAFPSSFTSSQRTQPSTALLAYPTVRYWWNGRNSKVSVS
jgi:K+-sensing histidine kinase KdpD